MTLTKRVAPIIFFLLVLTAGSFLRLQNLGYSEFQDDEKKAFIRPKNNQTVRNFLMDQRKGPMQFFVTSATMQFVDDPRDELLVRLPFAIINIASIAVFYILIKEIMESHVVAGLSSFLYASNGFVVGFSRIAQYQNINLLFSLLAMYFFVLLSRRKSKHLFLSFMGTLSFAVSLMAHWDAIFFLVPIIYFYGVFLARKDISIRQKVAITVANVAFGCVLLLPFLVPYIKNQLKHESNVRYFGRRVGLSTYSWIKHKFIFELYNPFVTLYFLPALAVFSVFKIKKSFMFIIWFVVNLLLIRFYMQKPGTHIYNYVIPLIFLAAWGLNALYGYKRIFFAVLPVAVIPVVFLYYQSFVLFVEHTQEYPWDSKRILQFKKLEFVTTPYSEPEILTFGFPHFRNWKEINTFVKEDLDECSYITNEGKEISQIYMDNKYGIVDTRPCYYIIDITRPFNIRGDGAVYAQTKGKEPVYVYSQNNRDMAKVYKIKNNKYKANENNEQTSTENSLELEN